MNYWILNLTFKNWRLVLEINLCLENRMLISNFLREIIFKSKVHIVCNYWISHKRTSFNRFFDNLHWTLWCYTFSYWALRSGLNNFNLFNLVIYNFLNEFVSMLVFELIIVNLSIIWLHDIRFLRACCIL